MLSYHFLGLERYAMSLLNDIIVDDFLTIPAGELELQVARASGAGGQNVNKVNSKAVIRWSPTLSPSLPTSVKHRFLARFASQINNAGEIVIASERHRDLPRNCDDCLDKIREMILAVRKAPKVRRATKPTKASKAKRVDTKRKQSKRLANRRWSGDD